MLVDYRGHFYSSVTHPYWTMRVDRIVTFLREAGCEVRVCGFSDLDVRHEDLRGWWILYTSQEDPHLLYKNYIEDVILAAERKGGRLIPRFELFRAHHDKVFMELLRDTMLPKEFHTIRTWTFGTLEEAQRTAGSLSYPLVVKPAEGAMSTGVALVHSPEEFIEHAAMISLSATRWERLKQVVKRLVRDPQAIKSIHRCKFVAQTFVPGLTGDYKVLVYGDRYYVLMRTNRPNDFRASGSGRFRFDGEVPPELLDMSEACIKSMDSPFVSLDIAYDGKRYHLLEMQFMMFGNVTVERSQRHYRRIKGRWTEVTGGSDLEQVFSESLLRFIGTPSRRRKG